MAPAGRKKGKVEDKESKIIFSIQMNKLIYNVLKEAAEEEDRSVSKMADILIRKGLFPDED